jgi:hemoglobin
MRTHFGCWVLVLLTVGTVAAQEDKPAADEKSPDRRIYKAVLDVLTTGVTLHNGDPARGIRPNPTACYHVYHGGLLALQHSLDAYPELQKAIPPALARAAGASEAERGFILREMLDKVLDAVKPKSAATVTLWDRLGGEKNVAKVVDDLVTLAAADPKVDFFRGGKFKPDPAELKKQLVAFISAAAGGPIKYTGRDMKAVHQGMEITDEQFNALAGHLQTALRNNGAKAEDITAVLGAVEKTRKDIVEEKK